MTSEQIEVMHIMATCPTVRKAISKELFSKYDRVYPFTTESIRYYMKDLSNKSVLSVASSGDHAIEAYAHGAKSVDTFDLNVFTNYYQELKIEALKQLSFEEFHSMFTNEGHGENDEETFDIFNKIRNQLSKKTIEIFEYIIKTYVYDNDMLNNYMFFTKAKDDECKRRLDYFDEKKYYEVQKMLQGKTTTYINTNLLNLCEQLNKKYDYIFLSNISSYIRDIDVMISILKELKEFLKKDGVIYFGYVYGDDDFALNQRYEELDNISHEVVPSAKRLDIYTKDLVYKLKK